MIGAPGILACRPRANLLRGPAPGEPAPGQGGPGPPDARAVAESLRRDKTGETKRAYATGRTTREGAPILEERREAGKAIGSMGSLGGTVLGHGKVYEDKQAAF